MGLDQPHRAIVRRCAFAPVIAVLGGCSPREATRQAWLWCRNTRTHGYIIQLEKIG